MKAKFLKLAGVKTEKEFYKKFPTEEAFMKKYGDKLKKAEMGDYISGPEAQEFKPLIYSDVTDSVESSMTGISAAEKKRKESLAVQQQIAANKGGGLTDMLQQFAPQIGQAVTQLAGAKNGKRLKKAVDGLPIPGEDYMTDGSLPPDTTSYQESGFADNIFGSQVKSKVLGENPQNIKGMGSWGKIGQGLKQISPVLANQLGPIIGGFEQIDQEKRQLKELEKYGKVSDVVAQAAASRPEQSQRRYLRPEDNLINNVSPRGTGTNYLAAKNGTEIQNTYAPDVMYTDLGYEPLEDSNPKQYKKGGKMKKADLGSVLGPLSGIGGSLGGWGASALGGGTRPGAGSKIGSSIGGAIGTAFGPVGNFVGSTLGGFVGGLFGGDGEREKQIQDAQDKFTTNTLRTTGSKYAKNVQSQYKSVMEHGGWVSNDWQPQVIAKFGDYSMKDLLQPPHDADMLRAGGHLKYYTPPSERAMYTGKAEDGAQLALGGDLKVLDGGYAETISYNPYMPGTGETIMFRGRSHDDGGIPVEYGQNGVEVEGGEPMFQMQDGGQISNPSESNTSGVVAGNMFIPDYGVNEIDDPKAKGMKFKIYIADLSKQESKQNKITDKATELVNLSDTNDPFELLAFNSGKAMLTGANMKLKDIANKKMNTAAVQNAILETAEEYGLDSAKLAKTQLAKFGGKFTAMPIADQGKKMTYDPSTDVNSFIKSIPFAERKQMAINAGIKDFVGSASQNKKLYDLSKESTAIRTTPVEPIPLKSFSTNFASPQSVMNASIKRNDAGLVGLPESDNDEGVSWGDVTQLGLTSASQFLRPRVSNPLSPEQLAPEMAALAMNQVEPVPMQSYEPILPQQMGEISYQDQLNEITAQSRVAERMAAYNPQAAASIFGQVAQMKSKVLGEQFRQNQLQDQQYSEARAQILNDAKLKNLAMYDQQAVRQAESKSKTKTQDIEVYKSIADKIAQNKLENKSLNVMQNMFPAYSFTSEGDVYKNPLYQAMFNVSGLGTSRKDVAPEGYEYETILKKKKDSTAKNGTIVKAFKNF